MVHAARKGDIQMFECLVEQRANVNDTLENLGKDSSDTAMVAAMLQHRQNWVDLAVSLTRCWRLPLTAVRLVHEYVVGFNWAVVSNEFNSASVFRVNKPMQRLTLG